MAKSANNSDDDNRLISAGRALYEALVKCDANASTLEALGRAIFAKTEWSKLPGASRLVMVRTILMMEIPKDEPPAEEATPEGDTDASA